jgi:hypothetical protein
LSPRSYAGVVFGVNVCPFAVFAVSPYGMILSRPSDQTIALLVARIRSSSCCRAGWIEV